MIDDIYWGSKLKNKPFEAELFSSTDSGYQLKIDANTLAPNVVGGTVTSLKDVSNEYKNTNLTIVPDVKWTITNNVYSRVSDATYASITGGTQNYTVGDIFTISFEIIEIQTGAIRLFRRLADNSNNETLPLVANSLGIYEVSYDVLFTGSSNGVWIDSNDFSGKIQNISIKKSGGIYIRQSDNTRRPILIVNPENTPNRNIAVGAQNVTNSSNWSNSLTSGGILSTKIGTGYEDGIPYVDLKMTGTSTATEHNIGYANLVTVATVGNSFSSTVTARVIAGTPPTATANSGIKVTVLELNSNASAQGGQVKSSSINSNTDVTVSASKTIEMASSVSARQEIVFDLAVGAVADVTYRIKGLQHERTFKPTALQMNYSNNYVVERGITQDYALVFDGTNDYFSTNYVSTGTTREIHANVKVSPAFTGTMVIVGSKNATTVNNSYMSLQKVASDAFLRAQVGSTVASYIIPPELLNSKITVGFNYNGAVINLFVNGVNVSQENQVGDAINSQVEYIGALNNNGTPANYFAGNLYYISDINRIMLKSEREALIRSYNNKSSFYCVKKYRSAGPKNPEDLYTNQLGFLYTTANNLVYPTRTSTTSSIYGQTVGRLNEIHGGVHNNSNILNGYQDTLSKRPVFGREPVNGKRNFFNFSNRLDQTPWNPTNAEVKLNTIDNFNNIEIFDLGVVSPYTSGQHYVEQNMSLSKTGPAVISLYVYSPNINAISNSFTIQASYNNGVTTTVCSSTFNLNTASITSQTNCVGTINYVVDGWYRISISHSLPLVSFNSVSVKFGYFGSVISGNPSVIIAMPQYEYGTVKTKYQNVINNSYIEDLDSRSYNFIRFDGVDDKIVTNIPMELYGQMGTLFAFGKSKSILYPYEMLTSSFEFGHSTFTSGPPNIIDTLGDILGYGFINKKLNKTEYDLLVNYFGMQGAGGNVIQ